MPVSLHFNLLKFLLHRKIKDRFFPCMLVKIMMYSLFVRVAACKGMALAEGRCGDHLESALRQGLISVEQKPARASRKTEPVENIDDDEIVDIKRPPSSLKHIPPSKSSTANTESPQQRRKHLQSRNVAEPTSSDPIETKLCTFYKCKNAGSPSRGGLCLSCHNTLLIENTRDHKEKHFVTTKTSSSFARDRRTDERRKPELPKSSTLHRHQLLNKDLYIPANATQTSRSNLCNSSVNRHYCNPIVHSCNYQCHCIVAQSTCHAPVYSKTYNCSRNVIACDGVGSLSSSDSDLSCDFQSYVTSIEDYDDGSPLHWDLP